MYNTIINREKIEQEKKINIEINVHLNIHALHVFDSILFDFNLFQLGDRIYRRLYQVKVMCSKLIPNHLFVDLYTMQIRNK